MPSKSSLHKVIKLEMLNESITIRLITNQRVARYHMTYVTRGGVRVTGDGRRRRRRRRRHGRRRGRGVAALTHAADALSRCHLEDLTDIQLLTCKRRQRPTTGVLHIPANQI